MSTATIETPFGRPTLTSSERTALITQVKTLETSLFDGELHVRREVAAGRATELLNQINVVRGKLGWLPIDDHHQHHWPDDMPLLS
ncbi:MAG: hypothetical protein J2P57_13720 [Acidimicrobiaceae bacterium]|nr:hypothetical protein [Acidimicrobiaceae bacterium]